jgi:hypothetical protein
VFKKTKDFIVLAIILSVSSMYFVFPLLPDKLKEYIYNDNLKIIIYILIMSFILCGFPYVVIKVFKRFGTASPKEKN